MGRVAHQKSAKQSNSTNTTRGAKVAKQRKNHKVVVESESHDQEKSRAVLSFQLEPPPGYTFIPAGNPQLTSALKEFAKKENLQVLAVTTTPHASRHELSREVHRIGFHFPTQIVAQVCNYYGIRLTSGGKLIDEKDDDKLFMRVYQKGQLALDEKVRDQVTINTEAKQIIKDLFPNIPDNDLFQIIKTAFQLGDGKVGTADEIPLVRRAQLSVVAHIRHVYTSYDKLLRQVPYSEARHRVESITLQKLIAWRGDDEDNQAMDDTLREVVVISDEEESEDEVEEGQVVQHEHLRIQPVNGMSRQINVSNGRPYSPVNFDSEDEAPRGYRYLPQAVRRYQVQDSQAILAARQQSRYAVWDRMRQEYRTGASPPPTRVVERILLDDIPIAPPEQSIVGREPIYVSDPTPRRAAEPLQTQKVRPNPPNYIRGADGKLYERVANQTNEVSTTSSHRRIYTPPSATYSQKFIEAREVSPRRGPRLHRRTESYEHHDGSIMPSIEGVNDTFASPTSRRNPFAESHQRPNKRQSDGYYAADRQAPLIDLTNSAEQASKRQRQETPPSPYLRRGVNREQNGNHRYEDRTGLSRQYSGQYAGVVDNPEQGGVILLDNPSERYSTSSVYTRINPRPQPAVVYREEVNGQGMPSPHGQSSRILPSNGIRNSHYVEPATKTQRDNQLYASDFDHSFKSYSGRSVQNHAEDEVANLSNRIVHDKARLNQQTVYTAQPPVRYNRPENSNPFEARDSSQYYVQDLPSDRLGRTYVPVSNDQYNDPQSDVRGIRTSLDGDPYRKTRILLPPTTTARNGINLRTTYVQN